MTTHTITITATTVLNLTADQIIAELDEIIDTGQSVAREIEDDEEATDRSRQEAERQGLIRFTTTPGLTDKQRATVAAALYQLASTFSTLQVLDTNTKILLTRHNPHVTVAELRQLASTFTRGLP